MTTQPVDGTNVGGLLVYRFPSELTTITLDQLRKDIIAKAKEQKVFRVLINLSEVDYMSSKDLRVFIQILKTLDDEGKKAGNEHGFLLAMCDLTPSVSDVIRVTNLGKVFRVFETQQEAIQSLTSGQG